MRRNRRAVTAAAVVAGVVAAGAAGTAWGLVRAREAEQRREADARAYAEELRQEKVRRLLDTGYLAAMSGDDATARQAAGEAELAGALGQSAMIRGLIAFYKDNLSEAADELRLAAELLPGSAGRPRDAGPDRVHPGRWPTSRRVLAELVALEPVTPEDYLFKGLGLSVGDASQGLPLLDEAARRPSPVVWLVRAEARTSYLQQVKPDPDLTVRACQDAVMARQALKDSVPALRTSLRTHLVASRVFQKAGVAFDCPAGRGPEGGRGRLRRPRPVPVERGSGQPAVLLRPRDRHARPGVGRARACVAACPNDPVVAGNLAQQLYLHGQYADAAAVPKVTTWVKILATAEPPGSRDRAHALYLATAGPGQPAWETYNGLLVLAAIGYPAEVAERATALLQRPETFPPLRPEQFNRLVRFLADPRADEAAFLADPTFNRGDQSNARLSVGLRQLARGERDLREPSFRR